MTLKENGKYTEVENILRNITRLKTNENFLDKLEIKLDEREAEKEAAHHAEIDQRRRRFIEKVLESFRRPYTVPAIALIVFALLIIYFIFLKTETSTDKKIQTDKQEEIQKKNEIGKIPVEEKSSDLSKDFIPPPKHTPDNKEMKKKTPFLQRQETKKEILPPLPEKQVEKMLPSKNEINNLSERYKKIPSVVPPDSAKQKEIVKADAKTDSNEIDVGKNSLNKKLNLIDVNDLEKLKEKIFKIK